MSEKRTVTNVTRQRFLLPGHGLVEPEQTVDVEDSDSVRELLDAGVRRAHRAPKTKQRPERAPDPTPTPEED